MTVYMSGAIVIACLIVMVLAADALIRGAIGVARSLKISPLLVGLTLVALGTSAPELAIALQAIAKGAPGQALGNITGSTIASCFFVVGIAALIAPLATAVPGMTRGALAAVAAAALWVGLLNFGPNPFTRTEAYILLGGLAAYVLILALISRNPKSSDPDIVELRDIKDMPGLPTNFFSAFGAIIFGAAALTLASHFGVGQSIALAKVLGVSDERIGLSLLAIGTSLPELAASLVASFRKRPDLAIGNVLGSVVFNVLGVGGAAALAGGIEAPARLVGFDSLIMLACVLALSTFVILRRKIGFLTGIVMLTAYGAYLVGAVLQEQNWTPGI